MNIIASSLRYRYFQNVGSPLFGWGKDLSRLAITDWEVNQKYIVSEFMLDSVDSNTITLRPIHNINAGCYKASNHEIEAEVPKEDRETVAIGECKTDAAAKITVEIVNNEQ